MSGNRTYYTQLDVINAIKNDDVNTLEEIYQSIEPKSQMFKYSLSEKAYPTLIAARYKKYDAYAWILDHGYTPTERGDNQVSALYVISPKLSGRSSDEDPATRDLLIPFRKKTLLTLIDYEVKHFQLWEKNTDYGNILLLRDGENNNFFHYLIHNRKLELFIYFLAQPRNIPLFEEQNKAKKSALTYALKYQPDFLKLALKKADKIPMVLLDKFDIEKKEDEAYIKILLERKQLCLPDNYLFLLSQYILNKKTDLAELLIGHLVKDKISEQKLYSRLIAQNGVDARGKIRQFLKKRAQHFVTESKKENSPHPKYFKRTAIHIYDSLAAQYGDHYAAMQAAILKGVTTEDTLFHALHVMMSDNVSERICAFNFINRLNTDCHSLRCQVNLIIFIYKRVYPHENKPSSDMFNNAQKMDPAVFGRFVTRIEEVMKRYHRPGLERAFLTEELVTLRGKQKLDKKDNSTDQNILPISQLPSATSYSPSISPAPKAPVIIVEPFERKSPPGKVEMFFTNPLTFFSHLFGTTSEEVLSEAKDPLANSTYKL